MLEKYITVTIRRNERDPNFAPGAERVRAIMALIIGASILIFGLGWVHHLHNDVFLFGKAAEGTVIENQDFYAQKNNHGHSGRTAYCAVVRFTGPDGKETTFTDRYCSRPAPFAIGQKTGIYYDPQDPQRAMVDRGSFNYLIPGICTALGVLLVSSGLRSLISRK